jgi:hypothetical protein
MCLLSTGNLDYLPLISSNITNSIVKPTYSPLSIYCLLKHIFSSNNGNLHELTFIKITNLQIIYSIKIRYTSLGAPQYLTHPFYHRINLTTKRSNVPSSIPYGGHFVMIT